MFAPPPLADEAERQAVVDALGILDTGFDPAFAELVELAAFVCHMPIAAMSLIDHDRQWFKSTLGLDTDSILGPGVLDIPRGLSFCGHTIIGDTMVVNDTTHDDRFVDSPFVTGPPHVRFYAGTSIAVDGHHVGTLCVMDTRPRTFLSDEQRALAILGRQVGAQLRIHRPV